jgi:hypothetical protein
VDSWLKFNKYGITLLPLANGTELLLPDKQVAFQKNGTINDLEKNINSGKLTIVGVSWQTTSEILNKTLFENEAKNMFKDITVGHWMVAVGYIEYSNTLIFLDPGKNVAKEINYEDDPFRYYSYSEFSNYWHRQRNLFIGSGDMITIQ